MQDYRGTTYTKTLPIVDSDTAPYWEAAREHRLELMRCVETRQYIHPPGPGSPFTGTDNIEWVDLGSEITGTVYSYIVVHRAFGRGFAQDAPYVVALVDVDQAPGARITARILGVDHEIVEIDMPVRMIWEDVTDEITLPQWQVIN